jgi:hypothetical protein
MSLHLSHYAGAYGPTLRIGAQNTADLIALKEIFGSLSTGRIQDFDLARGGLCQLDNVSSLLLAAAPSPSAKSLIHVGVGAGGADFEWRGSVEEWADRTSKTEALIRLAKPSHQYLSLEGVDDALIELSFLET